jgi:alpha-glucosidase (family GH31 glycosyl hydrolase)
VGWYDFWSGDRYQGGQRIVLPAPWDRPPLLAKRRLCHSAKCGGAAFFKNG